MENTSPLDWVDAPWWLDGVPETDVAECPEQWAVADPGSADFVPLSVAETLLAASLVGPGAEAIRLLDSLRGQQLSDDQRLTVAQLWQGQKSWVAGAEQAAVHAFAPVPDPTDATAVLAEGHVHLELAPALHTSTDQARVRIEEARVMHDRYQPTGDLLRAGLLDPYRVSLIVKVLDTLPPEAAAQVQAVVLPQAANQTPAQLRQALKTAAQAADPEWNAAMFARTRKGRRVGFDTDAVQGLVRMWADLPPVEAIAVQQALEAAAGKYDPADGRDHDERMADAWVAAVIGAEDEPQRAEGGRKGNGNRPVKPKVLIQVLVPLPTLLGMREDTAELRGYGDIPAEVARELAADAEWERWTYDPVDGHLLDLGKRRYRPSPELRRFLIARDRYDRFPGSQREGENCDAEHNQAFDQSGHGQGGSTSAAGMTMVPRPPHRAKTHADYQIKHDPDGTITWTTPLGRQYQTRPWDYRPLSDKG